MKPIIFSTESVKAILDDRKSQTRRIIKPQPFLLNGTFEFYSDMWHGITPSGKIGLVKPFKSLYKIGDKLWVRETFYNYMGGIIYKADNKYNEIVDKDCERWTSPIFMPKSAARIFLQVTNVRIERLNEISEKDCIMEGAIPKGAIVCGRDGVFGLYKEIWESIHGKNSWEINPWVGVIEFKKITHSD